MPQAAHGDDSPGSMTTFDWVDTATVVKGGGAGQWNDFAAHRPDTVPTIIRTLLSTDRLDCWIPSIHNEGAGLLLIRINGPAGPLHEVGGNGTHRTHAMRLLDVPRIAAEVYVPSLPLKLSTADVLTDEGGRPPMADLWQALIDRNLLTGQVHRGPVPHCHPGARPHRGAVTVDLLPTTPPASVPPTIGSTPAL